MTPLSDSPGISLNAGVPAPTPTKTASNPISLTSCSIVNTRPTSVLQRKVTPSCATFATSASTTALGSRNSGMP